jgi:predicted house-cleaning NTP pyrophosphatase (Maf/HAM1 superfamily)
LVLASGSPRRKQLLEEAVTIRCRRGPEVSDAWLTIREATAYNAMRKVLEVARAAPAAVVWARIRSSGSTAG